MTLPSIPDNVYKLTLLIGIFLMGYSTLEDRQNSDMYFSKVNGFNASIDSLDIEIMKIEHQKKKLVEASKFLSKRNGIENPILNRDSLLVFTQTITGAKNEVLVSDSLSILWDDYKESQFKIDMFNKQLKTRKEALKNAKEEFRSNGDFNSWLGWAGAFFFLFGSIGMFLIQDIQDELLKRQLREKPKYYKYCQSCGKKFSSMRHTSKNIDGTINTAFCTACFDNGIFIEPDLTQEEFKRRSILEVRKRKTWIGKKLLLSRLKKLERWDADDYF